MNTHTHSRKDVLFLLASLLLSLLSTSILAGTSVSAVSASPTAASGTYFDHVVIIMMEDHGINNICARNPPPCLSTNGDPYTAGLANSWGIGSQYLGVSHFSQADYIAILGGDTLGCVAYPCQPSSAANLVDRFEAAGLTWRGYMENQAPSSGCDSSYNQPYTPEHNPFVFFTDITNNPVRCSNVLLANPTTCSVTDCVLINDLNSAAPPNFMWLTPNNCNNMHGATGICSSSILFGDNYLSGLVPNIFNSQAFTTKRSALFLVFDEGNGYCPLNGSSEDCVYAVWAGQGTKTGFVTSNLYNHYSFTKTIETNWKLATLASNDAAATPMTEFFTTSPLSAGFVFSPSSPTIGQTVTFTGSASGGTSPYSFSWSFGDGGLATGNHVTHAYSASGTYTVSLTTSDSAGATVVVSNSITVSTSDFKLAAKSSLLTVQRGQNSQSQIAVTSLGGLKGTVALTASVSPQGLTVSMEHPSVALSVGQTVNDNLKVAASKTLTTGIYIVTVTGTSGSLVHALNVTVRVPDFNMTANPASLNISPGSSGSSQILFQSLYTFQGGITTTLSVSPAGPKATLNPNNPSLPVNGTKTSVLAVQVPSNQAAGVYNVTIKGTSGSILRLLVIPVHVGQHSSATAVGCLPSTVGVNQASTCTATVTDTSAISPTTPTGSVTFSETGPAGSFSPTTCTLVSSSCSITFSPTATGSALVTGTYAGDSSHGGSVSAAASITVNVRTTSTSLVCSSPTVVNQASDCAVTVTDSSGGSVVTPTGSVGFVSDSSGTFSAESCTITTVSMGVASCRVSYAPRAVGNHLIAGSYSGDAVHSTSSGPSTVRVGQRSTVTSVGCAPTGVGVDEACVATVTDNSPGTVVTPVSSVSFTTNSTGTFDSTSCTLSATGTTGVASCSVNYTPHNVGSHGITVGYAGDSSHLGSSGSVTLTVVAPSSPAYALVVSNDGKVSRLYQNGTLTLVGQPVTTTLRSVAWKPDGSYALISGDSAVLLRYDGTTLTTVPTGIGTGFNFWTVSWRPDGSYALVGGTSGILFKYDGVKITIIPNSSTTILAINWQPSANYALIVGKSGLTLTYDGTTVRSFTTGTTFDLDAAAWNPNGLYALIGGLNGTLLRFNGTTVAPINTSIISPNSAIRAVSFNPTGSVALLAGDSGMVLTYDGSTLTKLPTVTSSTLYSITWSSSGTAYIVGGSGTVLTYSNGALAKLVTSPVTTTQYRGIGWKPQ